VGVICISIITFAPQRVVVDEVAVPPSLVQREFTATIMARRLSDEIDRLSHSSATEGVEAVLFERTPDGVLPSLKTSASEGLWQPVERALRAISGNRTRTISGEIVENVGATAVPLY